MYNDEKTKTDNKKILLVVITSLIITGSVFISLFTILQVEPTVTQYCFQFDNGLWTFEGANGENGFKQIWQHQEDCESYEGDWTKIAEVAEFIREN